MYGVRQHTATNKWNDRLNEELVNGRKDKPKDCISPIRKA